jgi:carbonic anhydrase
MSAVRNWLKNAHAALSVAETLHERMPERGLIEELTEQNVLLQMRHLRTHPSVAAAMAAGELTMSGWVYEIGPGVVRVAAEGSHTFKPL